MTRAGKSQPAGVVKSRQRQPSNVAPAEPKSPRRRTAVKVSKRLTCPKHVLEQVVDMCGGSLKMARKWLAWPSPDLGWKPPLEVAQTEEGAERVIALIFRIEYGILV